MAIYDDPFTHKIIGCAMKVHSTLGRGFQEVIYQRALALEFEKLGIQFIREHPIKIFYENDEVGTRRVDFFMQNEIMIELKAVHEIENEHFVQIMNYLKASRLKLGLLLNFGSKSLQFKRIHNNQKIKRNNPSSSPS